MAFNAESVECIFDGTKFFWRTRTNLDVCIVEHNMYDIYEIIIYEPSCDIETPRIYLNGKVLRSKVEKHEIDKKLSFAKRNNIPLTEKFITRIINKCIADFLMNRINIIRFVSEEKHIDVEIQFSQLDIALGIMEPIYCNKPSELIPYNTKHYKIVMADVVQQALETLQHEKEILHETGAAADSQLQKLQLTVKERWRMPIVIVKVNHSKRLNYNDAKIFHRIQKNMKTEKDLKIMKSIMRSRSNSTNNTITTTTSITLRRNSSSSSCSTPRHSTMRNSSFSLKSAHDSRASLHRTLFNREGLEGTPRCSNNRAGSLRHSHLYMNKKHVGTPTTTNIDGQYDEHITTITTGGETSASDNEDLVTASNFSKVLARLNALGGSMRASFGGLNSTPTAFASIHETTEEAAAAGEGMLTTEGLVLHQQHQQQQVHMQHIMSQRRGSSVTSTPRHSHYHVLRKSSLSAHSPAHVTGAQYGGLMNAPASSFHHALLNREDYEGTPRNRNASRAYVVRHHSNRHLQKHAVTPTATNIDSNTYSGHGNTITTAVGNNSQVDNDKMVTANNFGKVVDSLNALGSALRSSFGTNSITTPCIEECTAGEAGRDEGVVEAKTGLVSPDEPYSSDTYESVPRLQSKDLPVKPWLERNTQQPCSGMGETTVCSTLASAYPSELNMKAHLETKPLTALQLQQERGEQEQDKMINQSVRIRPVKRGSMFGSFLMALSGRRGSSSVNNTSSESSKSVVASGSERPGTVSGALPALSRLVQWGTGAEGKVLAAQ